MLAYAVQIFEEKLAQPGSDLATNLVTVEVDGERLSPEGFAEFFLLLYAGGDDHFVLRRCERSAASPPSSSGNSDE